MRRVLLLGSLGLACASTLLLPGISCSRGPDPAAMAGHNVLLITLDTTRADRIGAYGYAKAITPVIDSLAKRGTLFEQAFAQVPLTLPSHSSIMTGRYPREHGLRDNAKGALGTEHPVLAEIFKKNGYRTGAFVAAFVLDSQFGLDRGFDLYSDDMGQHERGENPLHEQQPGDVITDRALAWLNEGPASTPFFCWVHYYDPHDPYMPPPEFRSPDREMYDGELAFVDSQVKRLLDWLDSKQLTDRTLIVVVGDHGESFNEHGEIGHTNFVYETNLHVPMMFVHGGTVPRASRVESVVEVVDVFATVLDLFGWEAPPDLRSRSLAPVFAGSSLDDKPAYSESHYVFNSYGWAEQRALTTAQWKYISSTHPELYDRRTDSAETKNLVTDEPAVAADLRETLQRTWQEMPAGKASQVEMDPQTLQNLRALGYAGGGEGISGLENFLTEGLEDPKDNKRVLELYRVARGLLEQAATPEDYTKIIPLIRDLAFTCPKATQFLYLHGLCLFRAGRAEEALVPLGEADKLRPNDPAVLELLGEAYLHLKRYDESLVFFGAAKQLDPGSGPIRVRLATVLERMGNKAAAVDECRQALALAPHLPKPYAKLCLLIDDPAEIASLAERLKSLIEADTPKPPARESEKKRRDRAEFLADLGLCWLRARNSAKAAEALRSSVELNPQDGEALINLGLSLMDQGNSGEAGGIFERASQIEGFEAEGRYHRAVLAARSGRMDEAVLMLEAIVASKPSYNRPILDLVGYYRHSNRLADMVRVLRAGLAASPNDPWMLNGLGQVLATCQDSELRDCATAVEVLERAASLTAQQEPNVLLNLAAAYACVGRFEDAMSTGRSAITQAEARQDSALLARGRELLDFFARNQPYLDPRL